MQINITVCMFQNQCVLKNVKLRKKKRSISTELFKIDLVKKLDLKKG